MIFLLDWKPPQRRLELGRRKLVIHYNIVSLHVGKIQINSSKNIDQYSKNNMIEPNTIIKF